MLKQFVLRENILNVLQLLKLIAKADEQIHHLGRCQHEQVV